MHDLNKTISNAIYSQFPEVFREDGPILVEFVRAYHEYLETDPKYSVKISRNLFDNRDIDTTLNSFLVHFQNQFLNSFPYKVNGFSNDLNKRFVIKHIMDYYRSKGTPRAAKLLLRMLFNQEAEVYYPGKDVIKPSESRWVIPTYIEVTRSERTPLFIDTQIVGARSGAKAFVESIIRKRIQGRFIDVLYLSNVRGMFKNGEVVTNDGDLTNSPLIIGSLSSLTIENGGQNNRIGDLFEVIDSTGKHGIARVTGTVDATGRVNFNIEEPGSGYSLDDYTEIKVATAMLKVDNSEIATNDYMLYERVEQPREVVSAISVSDILEASWTAGDYALGVKTYPEIYAVTEGDITNGQTVFNRNSQSTDDVFITVDLEGDGGDVLVDPDDYTVGATTVTFDTAPVSNIATYPSAVVKVVNYIQTANGLIVSMANTLLGEDVNQPATEGNITFVLAGGGTSGTFNTQSQLDFTTDSAFIEGELVQEEQTVELTVTNVSGTFQAGELIEQFKYEGTSPNEYIVNYAFGNFVSLVDSALTVDESWGIFENSILVTGKDSGATASVTLATVLDVGSTAVVSEIIDTNSVVVQDVILGSGDAFDIGKKVRGVSSHVIGEVNANTPTGADYIWLNGDPSANGQIATIANTTSTGIVVGSNSTWVGLWGNTSPFTYIEDSGVSIITRRELIKEHNLTTMPNKTKEVLQIATGNGATFEVGSLENEEVISVNTDLLGARNTGNAYFMDIVAGTAANSGVGFIASIDVDSGGSGYPNGQAVIFTNGGYAGAEPLLHAEAHIITDGSGTITGIEVDFQGEGYYEEPTATLPDNGAGVDATFTINMGWGYGFPKSPLSDSSVPIADMLNIDDMTIGSITSLKRINPGTNYNTDPFVSVFNRYVAAFKRKDIRLNIVLGSGAFKVGESVYQNTIRKGVVLESNVDYLILQRTSFNEPFTSDPLSGNESNATATVTNVLTVEDSLAMGENAVIPAKVIVADGVATSVEIKNSGYGYLGRRTVELQATDNPYIITAISNVDQQGIGSGYWVTEDSHTNSAKRIHDNKYYQEYSYDIQTGISLNRYRNIVEKVLHVAGTALFGTVVKVSNINNNVKAVNTNTDTVTVG